MPDRAKRPPGEALVDLRRRLSLLPPRDAGRTEIIGRAAHVRYPVLLGIMQCEHEGTDIEQATLNASTASLSASTRGRPFSPSVSRNLR